LGHSSWLWRAKRARWRSRGAAHPRTSPRLASLCPARVILMECRLCFSRLEVEKPEADDLLKCIGTESIQLGRGKIDLLKFLHAASRRCTDLVWG
jgi:hypothetical protein